MTAFERTLDSVDRRILALLQRNARTPNAAIARQLGMAPSAILERIRKLEERGVITGYHARLEPRALDQGLLAFIFVRTSGGPGHAGADAEIAAIPGVLEVHHVAGEDCYLVKVRSADTESLARLLRQGLGSIGAVRSTRTTIVLDTVKEDPALLLDGPALVAGEEVA